MPRSEKSPRQDFRFVLCRQVLFARVKLVSARYGTVTFSTAPAPFLKKGRGRISKSVFLFRLSNPFSAGPEHGEVHSTNGRESLTLSPEFPVRFVRPNYPAVLWPALNKSELRGWHSLECQPFDFLS